MTNLPDDTEAEVTILVGAMSREEFLGEEPDGDLVIYNGVELGEGEFVQPNVPGRHTWNAKTGKRDERYLTQGKKEHDAEDDEEQ